MKTSRKIVDLNPNISVTSLNAGGKMFQLEDKDCNIKTTQILCFLEDASKMKG